MESDNTFNAADTGTSAGKLKQVQRDTAFGRRARIGQLFVFYVPLFITWDIILPACVGTSSMLRFGLLALASLILFAAAGYMAESIMLGRFGCRHCRQLVPDWHTDKAHRILYHCRNCGTLWDIGYKGIMLET